MTQDVELLRRENERLRGFIVSAFCAGYRACAEDRLRTADDCANAAWNASPIKPRIEEGWKP